MLAEVRDEEEVGESLVKKEPYFRRPREGRSRRLVVRMLRGKKPENKTRSHLRHSTDRTPDLRSQYVI
eukprot:scaffold2069_cov187-Amphora_coffeaeformis.AAC.29